MTAGYRKLNVLIHWTVVIASEFFYCFYKRKEACYTMQHIVHKMKFMTIICLIVMLTQTLTYTSYGKEITTLTNQKKTSLTTENTFKSASDAVNAMKIGWNLGNTFDAYKPEKDQYELGLQRRDQYQIMAMYATKNYSGWDASSVPYFAQSSGKVNLTWHITKLNSSTKLSCGRFGFQLINNALVDSGDNPVGFTVTKATFTKANGTVVELTEMMGNHQLPISHNVTAYVTADLTKLKTLATTADIIGGKLEIQVTLTDYPIPAVGVTVSKEAYYETAFGNPVTSKAVIDQVKAAGFGAVRIPVTYYNHIDESGQIDKAWLARLKQVVDYVLSRDMFCIINVHHDTGQEGWIRADMNSLVTTGEQFGSMWSQIATYFKDYDDQLLFEGYNELLNSAKKWAGAGADSYQVANSLNQIFVDAVRKTGGNNAQRNLIVNTYAASVEQEVIDQFVLPKDTAQSHLIAEAHYYGSKSGTIDTIMARLNTVFVSKGIPVIIGEFGTTKNVELDTRIESARHYVETAKGYNITCFWWDDGNYQNKAGAQCNYALLDRVSTKWYHYDLAKAIVQAAASGQAKVDAVEAQEAKALAALAAKKTAEGYIPISSIEVIDSRSGIDIGLNVDENTALSLDMAITDQNIYANFVQSYESPSNRLTFRYEAGKGIYVAYGWHNSGVFNPTLGVRFNITQKGKDTYVDGKLVRKGYDQSFNTGDSIIIAGAKSKVYGCKVWNQEKLVRDLIPVLDSKYNACLYDKVSKTYLYSISILTYEP